MKSNTQTPFVPYFLPRGPNNHPAGWNIPLASREKYARCQTSVCWGPHEPKEGRIGDKIGQNKCDENALFRGIFHESFRGNSIEVSTVSSKETEETFTAFRGLPWKFLWGTMACHGLPQNSMESSKILTNSVNDWRTLCMHQTAIFLPTGVPDPKSLLQLPWQTFPQSATSAMRSTSDPVPTYSPSGLFSRYMCISEQGDESAYTQKSSLQ